jgi:hypothetical protein
MKKKLMILLITMLVLLQIEFIPSIYAVASVSDTSSASLITVSLTNQDPDPAIAGNLVEVRLGVENIGGKAAENLVVELLPEYPFTLTSGQSAIQTISTIQGYQSGDHTQIIKYKLLVDKDATAGTYELKIKHYEEGSSNFVVNKVTLDIKSQDSVEIIHIDKTSIVPGKQSSLKFTINNVGNSPLKNIAFSWSNNDDTILPVGSDNTKYIKYLDVGKSADVEYQVLANSEADAGLYKLDLQLTYADPLSGTDKTISTIAGVYVGGGTDFDVAYSESSNSDVSFTIANTGSNPAYSVSVIIPQQTGWSVSGANSVIIGNLNKGDYTVATFALQQTPSMAGTRTQNSTSGQPGVIPVQGTNNQNNIKVQIAYTDTMGNRETIDKDVVLKQSSTGNSTASNFPQGISGIPSFGPRQDQSLFSKYGNYFIYFVLLLAVIFVGVVYGKYRKQKMLDPNYKIIDVFKKKQETDRKRK